MTQNQKNQTKYETPRSPDQKIWRTNSKQNTLSGWSSKNTSKITMQTKRATINYETIIDDADDQESQPLPSETEEAKRKVHKLHGINFGRSLTLQDGSYIILEHKTKIIRILIIIGLICFAGFFLLSGQNNNVQKVRNKKKNSSKHKKK